MNSHQVGGLCSRKRRKERRGRGEERGEKSSEEGGGAAFDLAVIASLRHRTLHHLLSEAHKPALDSKLANAATCRQRSFAQPKASSSCPLLLKSGSVGGTATKTWLVWPKPLLLSTGMPCLSVSVEASHLYEMLAVILQRRTLELSCDASLSLRKFLTQNPLCCNLVGPFVGLHLARVQFRRTVYRWTRR